MTASTTAATYRFTLQPGIASTVLVPNANRDGFVVQNLGGVVFVKLAKYASNTDFTFRLSSKTILEHCDYSGWVSAVADTTASDILITELL